MDLVKRFAVSILGFGLLAVGVVLIILPGPGILLIVAGLAVLATEYAWARRMLVRARLEAQRAQAAAVASPLRTGASIVFALGMVGIGVAMLLVDDVAWPVLDGLIDSIWGPLTGGILVVTGSILLVTTGLTLKSARSQAQPDLG